MGRGGRLALARRRCARCARRFRRGRAFVGGGQGFVDDLGGLVEGVEFAGRDVLGEFRRRAGGGEVARHVTVVHVIGDGGQVELPDSARADEPGLFYVVLRLVHGHDHGGPVLAAPVKFCLLQVGLQLVVRHVLERLLDRLARLGLGIVRAEPPGERRLQVPDAPPQGGLGPQPPLLRRVPGRQRGERRRVPFVGGLQERRDGRPRRQRRGGRGGGGLGGRGRGRRDPLRPCRGRGYEQPRQ